MAKADTDAELAQPSCGRRGSIHGTDAVRPGRAPYERGFSERLRCRDEQQSPRLFRQRRHTVAETIPDGAGQHSNRSCPEAGECRRAQITRDLEQAQWVTARLSDESIAHLLIDPEWRC